LTKARKDNTLWWNPAFYFLFDETMYAQDRICNVCFNIISWRGGFIPENLIVKPKAKL